MESARAAALSSVASAEGDFSSQVEDIEFPNWRSGRLLDSGQATVQQVNGSERRGAGAAGGASGRGNDESRFDDRQRDVMLPKLTNKTPVGVAQTARRVEQARSSKPFPEDAPTATREDVLNGGDKKSFLTLEIGPGFSLKSGG